MELKEKCFESDIENYLITEGGYEQFSYANPDGHRIHKYVYDKKRAYYPEILQTFIQNTQPKAWEKYKNLYKNDAEERLYQRIQNTIQSKGLLYTLKNGIEDLGIKIKLCYFKPESELNAAQNELYRQNILGCTRQFAYSANNNNTIDMVLSVNGFPIVALELKNQYTGQNADCAIEQYRNDRSSKEFCFKLNNRFLVYFAVDLYEAYMTTCLNDGRTHFVPFNQGSNGAGVSGGKGNPPADGDYVTSYLWKNVLNRDNLIDIINKFFAYVCEKTEVESDGAIKVVEKKKLIFPRYHQFDVVRKITSDVKEYGTGKNYLIEHSAGSGKSNSIAWIAYRLASLHNDFNEPVFDSVIVVTNRIVLDSQLQDTINSFDHTPGLVEPIDDKKKSRGLTDAINDKKRVIICTIQKFLFAYKDFVNLKGRKFAIIIDEAHQGQSGESAKTLRKSLIDPDLAIKAYAEEEGINEDELDDSDALLITLMSQGQHANQSFFAFTATPSNKTLELFGTPDPATGKMRPFHVYSMRQAIEEGFILDVLSGYTTIKETFKIVRTSQDNPELLEGPALKAIVRYYKEHGHTIAQKTDLIMANFLQNGRFQIDGRGKAMIIADSRANAVRYFLAVKDYMKQHPLESKGCGVMVAFSGTVDLNGVKYEEKDLNFDNNGYKISSDKKFRREFRSERNNILIVANKYQTGFDEPLLHSMYVDKKLKGINAVQTLSRLNRTAPGKTSTFVLDFANSDETIKESFQPFYQATLLDGRSDFNRVYDLRSKIKEYMLFNTDDVNSYYAFMIKNEGSKQSPALMGKLSSIIKPVVDRYNDLANEEEKFNARMDIRKFVKSYAYVTQLIRLHDEELFKEYVFCSHLLKLLPAEKNPPIDWLDKIKLEYASLTTSFKGEIILDKQDVDLTPSAKASKPKLPKKDALQNIIDRINDRYEGDFTESDRVIVGAILDLFMKDKDIAKFRRYAKDNNSEVFAKGIFPEKFKQLVSDCCANNTDAFTKLYTDENYYSQILHFMASEIYKLLRSQ